MLVVSGFHPVITSRTALVRRMRRTYLESTMSHAANTKTAIQNKENNQEDIEGWTTKMHEERQSKTMLKETLKIILQNS